MEYEFNIQDPSQPKTLYLAEAIIAALPNAAVGRGVFAFASRGGIDALVHDPEVIRFLGKGTLELILGIDAITNRATLERFQELERQFPSLSVRVFWNRWGGLFHPKFMHFKYADGRQTFIVGSGNLTPGGLQDNFEAYSILRAARREKIDLSSLDTFLAQHAGDIRAIDTEALERAAKNVFRGGGRRRRRDTEPDVVVEPATPEEEEEAREAAGQRILVAQVPAAGGRWHQVHLNEEVVEQFFQVHPESPQRAFLRERGADGSLGEQEIRPCVMSHTNKNRKIELKARPGVAYPQDGPPIAIFRELQVRTFEYMLLLPGEPGYAEMLRLTKELPSVGKGLPRVITDVATAKGRWPNCPLY